MTGVAHRWAFPTLLSVSAVLSTACARHFYPPAEAPGPERLLLSVQHTWSSTAPYEAWASAVVTWPNGAYQPVDHLQIWLRTDQETHTAEDTGRSDISVEARPAGDPVQKPKSYGCATYKGQTWCAGDPVARPSTRHPSHRSTRHPPR